MKNLNKFPATLKKTLLIVSSILLTCYLASLLYVYSHALTNNAVKSDAVIVLGSRTRKGNSYNPCLVARVKNAVDLVQNGSAQKIIVSGGYNPDDHYVEADDMAKIAQSFGAKPEDILEETKSTSTYENLLYSKTILKENHLSSVIISTEPYHLPRANLIAQKLNLTHSLSPALGTPCWNSGFNHLNYYTFRDALALLVYKIQGKI